MPTTSVEDEIFRRHILKYPKEDDNEKEDSKADVTDINGLSIADDETIINR